MNKQTELTNSPLSLGWRVGTQLLFCCFLLSACTQADDLHGRDGAMVRFSLSSGAVSTEEIPTRIDVSMAEGTEVRVLAYCRPDGAADAVLSNANYAGESTYRVSADGTLQAAANPLQLIAGTYDFYAVTPALAVDHSGSQPTVSVGHRTDYAVSLTTVKTITAGSVNSVALETLARRCSLLSFATDLKEGVTGITSARITSVRLTGMTDEPRTATGTGLLPLALGTTEVALLDTDFAYPDADKTYQAHGQVVVLPKQEAPFNLTMKVCFNGSTTPLTLNANLEKIRFEPGCRYAFAIRFRQPGDIYVELVLTVAPWTLNTLDTSMGGVDNLPIQVTPLGYWTLNTSDTSLGGADNVNIGIGVVAGWTLNTTNTSIGGIDGMNINTGVSGGWGSSSTNTSLGELGGSNINTGVSGGWGSSSTNTSLGELGKVNINGGVGTWEDCNGNYTFGN